MHCAEPLHSFQLEAEYDGNNVTLKDICVSPMAPQKDECLIQSVFNYWQNDPELLDESIASGEYTKHIIDCVRYVQFYKFSFLSITFIVVGY